MTGRQDNKAQWPMEGKNESFATGKGKRKKDVSTVKLRLTQAWLIGDERPKIGNKREPERSKESKSNEKE